jgi:NAD-dependent deacetylase
MIDFSPEFLNVLKSAKRVAVLTGAGISAESGVATFRGKEGLWAKFRPEELASADAFMLNSALVWEWYQYRRDIIDKVQPNPGHFALADMEKHFKSFALITQNVDGLHRRAGSQNILELHGNITRNKCFNCGKPFIDEINLDQKKPPCCNCGGKIRPDVVWFGETLPQSEFEMANEASATADLFFAAGTSAIVYPAAGLPMIAKRHGAYLVEINIEPTPLTDMADSFMQGKSGEILPEIVKWLRK